MNENPLNRLEALAQKARRAFCAEYPSIGGIEWHQLSPDDRAAWVAVVQAIRRELRRDIPRLWHRVRAATGEPLTSTFGPAGPTGNPWDTDEWVLVEQLGPPISPNWLFTALTRVEAENGLELWFPIASGPNGPDAMEDATDGASSEEDSGEDTAY